MVAQDPEIRQSVGVDQVLDVINRIGQMLGLPRDFKLQKIQDAPGPDQQSEEMVKIAEEIRGSILEEVGQAIEPVAENSKQNSAAIEQIVELIKNSPQPPPEAQYDNANQAPSPRPAGAPGPAMAEVR
jgi:hypothetical protein